MGISVWGKLDCYCLLRIVEIKMNPKIGHVAYHSASTVLLTPLNLSQTVQPPTSSMSPTVEEVEADHAELSDPDSRASSDAEAVEMEPAVRSSIPISPTIVETRIKQKSKAPTPQSKTAPLFQGNPLYLPLKRRRMAFWEIPHKTTCLLLTECSRRSNLSEF